MMIEPSRWMGSGKRIPIQFAPNLRFATDPARPTYASLHKGISVFPGAMAAFKGSKGHSLEGGFFMVREILPVSLEVCLRILYFLMRVLLATAVETLEADTRERS